MQRPEFPYGLPHHSLGAIGISDIVLIDHRLPASILDLGNHVGRRADVIAGRDVVDHDGCTLSSKEQCMLPAYTAASTGYHCNSSVQSAHHLLLADLGATKPTGVAEIRFPASDVRVRSPSVADRERR